MKFRQCLEKNDGENGKLCQKIWRFDYFMLEAHELQCFMPTNDYHEGLRRAP